MAEREQQQEKNQEETSSTDGQLKYTVNQAPSWPTSIFLGFQHYTTMVGATFTIPFLLSEQLCLAPDSVIRSHLMGTILFISGIVTCLQSTFGVRLPIIQGGTFSFLLPTFAILSLPQWKCSQSNDFKQNASAAAFIFVESHNNSPDLSLMASTADETWKPKMQEIQGAIIVASLFEMVMGLTGFVGYIQRFIGPLTIAPVISLIGLSLFSEAANSASQHWGIAFMTALLVALFAEYQALFNTPKFTELSSNGCLKKASLCLAKTSRFCRLFPIILTIITAWLICFICTVTNTFPDNPAEPSYKARVDVNIKVIQQSPWFRIPFPFQWGIPTVSAASVLGMLAGVITGAVESVGDYYSCARFSGAPIPPAHAMNRGIFIEGLGCILAGIWGTGNGTTSYSENIGVIGITKVGSRRVIQCAGLVMITFGLLTKFCAVFISIPQPIIGGLFLILFGLVTAVGISNLQFVDLNSTRNLFVFGVSMFFGLSFPMWLKEHQEFINTGWTSLDQILFVLLRTSMFVGGLTAILLDNTMPGTPKERGLLRGKGKDHVTSADGGEESDISGTYDLPVGMATIRRLKWLRHVPISPTYSPQTGNLCCSCCCCTRTPDSETCNT